MKNQQEKQFIKYKKLFIIPFKLAKAFFISVTNIAFGIASIFLLNILIIYFLKEQIPFNISKIFLQLEMFCVKNIMWFLLIYLIVECYYIINEYGQE